MIWYESKQALVEWSGIGMDAWHILAGIVLQLAAALVLRRPFASWVPWIIVLLLEVGNEAMDLQVGPPSAMQYAEGAKDIVLTMLLPTLLLILSRTRPDLFARAPRDGAGPEAGSAEAASPDPV